MDKKGLGGMDPRLRQAYERVMGTNVAHIQAQSKTPQAQPVPTVPSPHQAAEPAAPQATISPQDKVISYNALKEKAKTAAGKGKGLPVPLLIVLAITFLLLYTVVWSKIFGIKLPFLPF